MAYLEKFTLKRDLEEFIWEISLKKKKETGREERGKKKREKKERRRRKN